ncbi:ABC transporter ATP-binding protein [Demequina aurantiaca]|uniref:ABC transporter ATP-binding protein n=1 Tax=Demequina aurantiaca TaxID=676200 RepID=UPI003D353219
MQGWGVRGLTVTYGDTVALDGVSVDLIEGEVLAIVGGDGAGKTTLLRALAGAVTASEGEVRAPGLASIGFMPSSAGVWRDLTVDQNIDFVAAAQGVTGAALRERRAELLGDTGLEGANKRLAGQLSGGMRQKLAFALAMIHRPPMLILDEPSTGVDPVSRIDLWRMISQAAVDGAAIIMATTYLDEAERASHVVVLDGGSVLLAGTPADVTANIPGHVADAVVTPDRVRSWRRGGQFKTWSPEDPPAGVARADDLEDAVIAATLAKEANNA